MPNATSDEATATPGGRWQLVHYGSGVVDGLGSDEVWVPVEDRIHVVLLPEGYLQGDLEVFDEDVADSLEDLRTIDVYSAYMPAFVIWKLPLASAQRVADTDPQTADTAFEVPISAGFTGIPNIVSNGPTSQRIWGELEDFPFPPTVYWPGGGKTNDIAKKLVVSVHVYRESSGGSGYSGQARRMTNPNDSDQRLSVGFGVNWVHEFSHAFSRVSDEYLSLDQSGLGEEPELMDQSAYVSNVVMSSACDDVPWQHLLAGSVINPETEHLVGAFGTQTHGYHSEFMCLMNGSSDNDVFYGGSPNLRTVDRMCNWCREVTTFRLFERVGLLDDPQTSFASWTDQHRDVFYEHYGFTTPEVVPQQNSEGTEIYEACQP